MKKQKNKKVVNHEQLDFVQKIATCCGAWFSNKTELILSYTYIML